MKKSIFLGLVFVVLSAFSVRAVPPHPDLEARLKAEGKWEEFVVLYKSWKGKLGAPNPDPYRVTVPPPGALGKTAMVPPDTLKVVVIYAAPSDRPTSADGINVTQAQLQTILFGANPTRNMTDYYKEISYGQMVILGSVYGPYTLPQTNAYYAAGSFGMGPYPNNGQKFVEDAVAAADSAVDFSQFDANGDGAVDGLFVIHSGPGGEQTGNGNDIWSHAYVFASPARDGKTLHHYALQPEQQGASPIQIGVFCHEAGHSLFGLPDLYDTDYSSSGLGIWCLMSGGNYLNSSRTPAHMSAWCKKEVGWFSPINLTDNQAGVLFPTVQFNPVCYRLWTNGTGGAQYFLVENRFRRGFDTYLPAGGLFIWHINDDISSNNNEITYKVALEQADGLFELENGSGGSDAADPFPGSTNNRAFSETSNPNSNDRNQAPTQIAVTNISNSDSVMTADLQVTYPQPLITLNRVGFIFEALYRGTAPAPRSLQVSNTGGDTLRWRADWNRAAGWLSVTPDSGTAPTTVSVFISSTGVPPGNYTDTIFITAPNALNTPQKLWVSYGVSSIRGDLNRDGLLAPSDVVELLNCVFSEVSNPDPNACELLVADMNCDGQLSPADIIVELRRVFVGGPAC